MLHCLQEHKRIICVKVITNISNQKGWVEITPKELCMSCVLSTLSLQAVFEPQLEVIESAPKNYSCYL